MQEMMHGMLWTALIYLHLWIGLGVGLYVLWRVKTKRRWFGALLAYLCLLLIVSIPFLGHYESRTCWNNGTSRGCTDFHDF